MIAKLVIAYGRPAIVACDGKCNLAWGIQNRPRIKFGDDPDDYAFLADYENISCAPVDPGTYEGGHGKPEQDGPERLNKWCFRECERSVHSSDQMKLIQLPDFSKRMYNQPWKHPEAA